MSNVVSRPAMQGPVPISDEQVEILRKTLFKGYSDEEIAFALAVCYRSGLDPFQRQIHFKKRKNRKTGEETIVFITGIDGFRLSANRSKAYAGSDEPVFTFGEKDKKHPIKATVTVYKMVEGVRCPFTASVLWDEFYPGDGPDGFMWRKMPHQMLGKCAEAQALRKAFPVELSGLYLNEEMDQANNEREIVQVKVKELTAKVQETEGAPEFESADYFEPASDPEPESQDPGEYVFPVGKRHKGKKLKDIARKDLEDFVLWADEKARSKDGIHPSVAQCRDKVREYIHYLEFIGGADDPEW